MAQELVLISKEKLSKQKPTPDAIITQDEGASVNRLVNNKQNSTLLESNKEDLRQDEEGPESLNSVQKLSESKQVENCKIL